MKKNIYKYLAGNDYPGRGIVLGQSPDGQKVFVAYWIMGRSANSRNRVFEPITGGIRTVAADPAKLEDPHLIIYNAVLTLRETTVVTNGDQTDTIAQFMNGNLFPGYSFEAALATRTYEDDAPNFTPRISGVVDMRRGGYKLSIVKSNEGNAASVQRQTLRDISSAPMSRTVRPSPALRGSRCALPSTRTMPTSLPSSCGPA